MSNTVKAAMGKADKVYDLDAAIEEAQHKPFRFTFAGREWMLPHLDDLNVWPLTEKIEQGDMVAAMAVFETAFGDDWDEFHAKPLTRGALQSLWERYAKHSGVEPGESPASIN